MNDSVQIMETTTTTTNPAEQASGFILKLYEMISGAPDELIRWTPAGDAFIIGSDLNRLESETLPYYFRHNRFQSLVRQLNFYSFRKVNRERNVWIYKHKLFHRDQPEDLHLVRRRTCPGVDGRKQRFSRLSARKLSRQVGIKKSSSSEEDDSSLEDAVVDDVSQPDKDETNAAETLCDESLMKRSRRLWTETEKPSIVEISAIPRSSFYSPNERMKHDQISEDDEASAVAKSVADKRLEMVQQSMVVSEVALKLEEYAKKAMKVSGTSRTRRGGLGIVTPPFGSSQSLSISTRGLITYDDEYDTNSVHTRRSSSSSAGLVSVGDECSIIEDEGSLRPATGFGEPSEYLSARELFGVPPVEDISVVKKITEQILQSGTAQNHGPWIASAAVTGFCMATPPSDDGEISNKILHLISSCPNLALEFQQYRAALHPQQCLGDSLPYPFTAGLTANHAVLIHQIWERAACRGGAVRDFKTFAVNTIHKVMSRVTFSETDAAALEHTAEVWLKSADNHA